MLDQGSVHTNGSSLRMRSSPGQATEHASGSAAPAVLLLVLLVGPEDLH
jgi:hypothetical protein